jgi:hypothetical protein
VVVVSPRRFGKTSLVKRVQEAVRKEGMFTVYVDFFGVVSTEDIAGRLASRVYSVVRKNESLTKKVMRFLSAWRPVIRPDPEYGAVLTVETAESGKRGLQLLDETLAGLGKFIVEYRQGCHIVFDEFQELVEIKESRQIEGLMRSHIQTHSNAAYSFVGSRRRILSEIFNERKRPFYGSAINYPLAPLPFDEAVSFIVKQFSLGGKTCSETIGRRIVEKVRGYPFYIQRIPYAIFEISGKVVTENDYSRGFRKAIEEETLVYESMVRAVAPQQVSLLVALAQEPTDRPYSAAYMTTHGLGSIGGIQTAIRKLTSLDYIEVKEGIYQVVDPVFGIWLRHLRGATLPL